MLSALRLITVMAETGCSLSDLAGVMQVFPQVLKNVEVDASRPDFMQVPDIAGAIDEVRSQLGDKGRVLVRYSGTQPLLRVMVEGPEMRRSKRHAIESAGLFKPIFKCVKIFRKIFFCVYGCH